MLAVSRQINESSFENTGSVESAGGNGPESGGFPVTHGAYTHRALY